MNWIIKEQKIRKIFLNKEYKKIINKSFLFCDLYGFKYKFHFDKIFKNFNLKISNSHMQTYCLLLNNKKSIFKKFKLSRHIIKKYANLGEICGLRKSSF
jgi:ribosomal protein S14